MGGAEDSLPLLALRLQRLRVRSVGADGAESDGSWQDEADSPYRPVEAPEQVRAIWNEFRRIKEEERLRVEVKQRQEREALERKQKRDREESERFVERKRQLAAEQEALQLQRAQMRKEERERRERERSGSPLASQRDPETDDWFDQFNKPGA